MDATTTCATISSMTYVEFELEQLVLASNRKFWENHRKAGTYHGKLIFF